MTAGIGAMDAVILCGGRGTRLRPVMGERQKVLAEVRERPFLMILVDYLAAQGFRRFVLATGHDAESVEELFAGHAPAGTEVVFSREPGPLGTAGAIRHAASRIVSDTFFVHNGDSLCPCDHAALAARHRASGALATIALVEAESSFDGGFVNLDERGRVLGFSEKLPRGSHLYMNAGTYVFQRALLDRIPPDRAVSLEREVFTALSPDELHGFPTGGWFHDIGTPDRLEEFRVNSGAWLKAVRP